MRSAVVSGQQSLRTLQFPGSTSRSRLNSLPTLEPGCLDTRLRNTGSIRNGSGPPDNHGRIGIPAECEPWINSACGLAGCVHECRSGTTPLAGELPEHISRRQGYCACSRGLRSRSMNPDRHKRKSSHQPFPRKQTSLHATQVPSSDDTHSIVYFKRHKDDDPSETSPGRDFLESCPAAVRAKIRAVLVAVAAAPPKSFSGGGYWEAMHDEMTGWFEVRVNGPQRCHYRLFCKLDYRAVGFTKPLLVIFDGRSKPFRTVLSDEDYRAIRELGDEYFERNPRSII